MNPNHSRVSFTTSNGGSSSELRESLSSCHPFTQQIDVLLFSPNSSLEQTLSKIQTEFHSGRVELADVLDAWQDGLTGKFDSQTDFVALAEGHPGVDDVWCIDHRGLLTLLLTKETYQQLGLVGEKALRKSEIYYIQIDLYDQTASLYTRAKERIRVWDERRKVAGILPWRVYIHGSKSIPALHAKLRPIQAQSRVTTLNDILIPIPALDGNEYSYIQPGDESKCPRGSTSEGDEGDEKDQNERLGELFEWIGMACLSSDRLKANDRPNSFVAQYAVPEPSRIGSVTHISWSGFFGPRFIRKILRTALTSDLSRSGDNQDAHRPIDFLSITSNLSRNAPISYISPNAFAEGAKSDVRLERTERKVECWGLMLILREFNVGPMGRMEMEDGQVKDKRIYVLARFGL